MEHPILRVLQAGLPVLQQAYSLPAGRQLHECLLASLAASAYESLQGVASGQKTGAVNVQVLQLVDQYLQWLLPAWDLRDIAATDSTTKTSSSSATRAGSHSGSDIGNNVNMAHPSDEHVHVACIIFCLQHYTQQISIVGFFGSKAAAAVRAHLLGPSTGEHQAAGYHTCQRSHSTQCLITPPGCGHKIRPEESCSESAESWVARTCGVGASLNPLDSTLSYQRYCSKASKALNQ
jgi:hypothetical protein